VRGNRLSGAFNSAIETPGLRIVNVKVQDRRIGEGSKDSRTQLNPRKYFGTDHHCVGIVGADRQEPMVQHGRNLAAPRFSRHRAMADEDWAACSIRSGNIVVHKRNEQNFFPNLSIRETDPARGPRTFHDSDTPCVLCEKAVIGKGEQRLKLLVRQCDKPK
jgi:hypothetical protein